MRIIPISFVFLLISLTAAIAAVSICNSFAESAITTTEATIVEPVTVSENMEIWTTGSFVSGMTGDLIIRIPAASPVTISAPLESENLEPVTSSPQAELFAESVELAISAWLTDCAGPACGAEPEAGALDGSPVSSIDISTSDARQASPTNINVIIAYN